MIKKENKLTRPHQKRSTSVETRITELLDLYASGSTKQELHEFATNRYQIKDQMFYIYWRWMMDEYALQVGDKDERIADHLRDLDALYRAAVTAGKHSSAKSIKKFIMELEGTYVPKDNSLFKSFDFDNVGLVIMGQTIREPVDDKLEAVKRVELTADNQEQDKRSVEQAVRTDRFNLP